VRWGESGAVKSSLARGRAADHTNFARELCVWHKIEIDVLISYIDNVK
jgi:hypothetical protein